MKLAASSPMTVAANSIARRRAACGDDFLEALPDEMLGVVRYVLAHPAQQRALAADAADALAIIRGLHAELAHLECSVIRAARKARLSWPEIAALLGVGSAQGAQQRAARLERRRERLAPAAPAGWLAANGTEVRQVAALIAALDLPDAEAADSAAELAAMLAEAQPGADGLMKWIVIVLDELKVAGLVECLGEPLRARVQQLAAEWERVRGDGAA